MSEWNNGALGSDRNFIVVTKACAPASYWLCTCWMFFMTAEKCARPIVAYVWSKQTVQRHWPTVWVGLVVLGFQFFSKYAPFLGYCLQRNFFFSNIYPYLSFVFSVIKCMVSSLSALFLHKTGGGTRNQVYLKKEYKIFMSVTRLGTTR